MTGTRTCDQCGKHLITHRADARFCDERCRARWNNKHRVKQPATNIRIATVDGGVGSRGGNVRSVTEARNLQSAAKELDRWRLIMEQQVFRTLLATGYFHVDDLDCLDLPPAAFEVRGTLVNRVRAKGWMQRSGAERKVAHKAANARKAPIYRITMKGRAELPGFVGMSADTRGDGHGGSAEHNAEGFWFVSPSAPPVSTHSGDSDLTGPGGGVGVANPQGPPGGHHHPAPSTDTASPDKPLAGVGGGNESGRLPRSDSSGHSPHSGESSSAGQLPGKRDQGRPEDPPSSAGAASPEPLSLLPEPDPESWAA